MIDFIKKYFKIESIIGLIVIGIAVTVSIIRLVVYMLGL